MNTEQFFSEEIQSKRKAGKGQVRQEDENRKMLKIDRSVGMHHVLRYALSLCDDRVILPEHLPEALSATTVHTPTDATARRARLEALLEENGWCIESAAKALGVARSTLYRQMDRFHIIPPNREVIAPSFDQRISRERQS